MSLRLFLRYLVASVLSMAAVRLANMADAALVGNIIGAEGLITVKKIRFDLVEILIM